MEKFEMMSPDLIQENINKIQDLFPECIIETKDKSGIVKKTVDFSKLKSCLGALPSEEEESYEFTWAGKRAAYDEATKVRTTKTLRPAPERSVDWNETRNLYIEGDNLDALKLLQSGYSNSVKMIYIDPPYNTGSDLIYRDDFKKSLKEYKRESAAHDEAGLKINEDKESGARCHSDWCSMIYSRLLLARNLLREDGAIFISIDDNELENLKKICNEVFGEKNFVGQWNWFKSATPPNLSNKIKKNIEYILCYEKCRTSVKYKGLKKSSPSSNGLLNQTNKIGILKFPAGVVETGLADGLYGAGEYGTSSYMITLLDDAVVKNGFFANEFRLQAKFKWNQEKLLREIDNGTTIAIRTKTFSPSYEKREYDPEVPPNFIDKSVNVDTTEQAGNRLNAMFGNIKIFDYPKPVELIAYLANFICEKDDLVMDFFSGSGTTAHAVMQTNALRNINRQFILVQIPEKIKEKKEAYKAGYKTICEIAEERIKRAAKEIKEETDAKIDYGFRVFYVDDSNMEDDYFSNGGLTPESLNRKETGGKQNRKETNVKPDRNDLDLFFGCLLEWGLPLSLPYTCEKMSGCAVYTCGDGELIACFQEEIPEEVIRIIAKRKPLRAVFRESCFHDSTFTSHVEEVFKRFSPDSVIRVI